MKIRSMLPQALLALVLVSAVILGMFGIRRAFGPQAGRALPAPAVLHWANEGVSDLASLDPVHGPDLNTLQATQLIFGGLVRFGPDFRILPDAATRWEVSGDGLTYTFHLRPGVRFGDGVLLTSSDVAYSLNRTLSRQYAEVSDAYLLNDIQGANAVIGGRNTTASGIQILDEHTLRIRLHGPTGAFLAKLATPAGYIMPRWRIRADPGHWDRHAVGTGPFMVGQWLANNALQLVPNPYYYGGKLQLGGIEMPFVPEPLAAYKRYRAGTVDVMGTISFPPETLFEVRDQSDFHPSARLETVYLSLNTQRAPFDNQQVRLAFAHAVNRDLLVSTVYGNFARPARGMLPPGILGYNPGLHGEQFDPGLARRLLASAGFPGGRSLPPITFWVDQDTGSLLLASSLAEQWHRVLGVQVHLVQQNHTTYNKLLQDRAYQLAVIDWTADYPDPENFLSQLLHTGSPNNNGHWSDPVFDRLVDRADRLPSADPQRLLIYRQAEERAMEQAASIPLVHPATGILLRQGIAGLQVNGGLLIASDWTKVSVAQEASQ